MERFRISISRTNCRSFFCVFHTEILVKTDRLVIVITTFAGSKQFAVMLQRNFNLHSHRLLWVQWIYTRGESKSAISFRVQNYKPWLTRSQATGVTLGLVRVDQVKVDQGRPVWRRPNLCRKTSK